MKCLVIGDTHFDDKYSGLLECHFDTISKLAEANKPKYVVFLGDIFHHRKQNPEVIVKTRKFFDKLQLSPGLTKIFVIRGNHDSSDKSDNGLTTLSILEYPGSKVSVITQTEFDTDLNFLFIPHYENEDRIINDIKNKDINKDTFIFGHFGYAGCLNSTGFFDFKIDPALFKCNTILGHIHRFTDNGLIKILGTPWPTSFTENDYQHYVCLLEKTKSKKWKISKLQEVDFGPRFFTVPYDLLDSYKEDLTNPKYFSILRVLVNKFSEDGNDQVIKKDELISKYGVKHVEVRFSPVLDKKLNSRISNYNPDIPLDKIDDKIIEKYIEENSTSIPTDKIKAGLDIILKHEDSEADS